MKPQQIKTPKTKKPTRNRILIYSNLHYMLHGGSWEDSRTTTKQPAPISQQPNS